MRAAIAGLVLLAGCTTAPREGLVKLGTNEQGAVEYLRALDGMVVVQVPAGEFTMGSDEGDTEERPLRKEKTRAFLIDKYEVTNDQFAAFLNTFEKLPPEEAYPPLMDKRIGGVELHEGRWRASEGRGKHPVTCSTWHGARMYAIWVDGRLPTDAEWEKAARGTDGRIYPWGNAPPDPTRCNFGPGGIGDTTPVGSYPAGVSAYGCMDMAGNVWERVSRSVRRRVNLNLIKSSGFCCPLAFQMRAADYCSYPKMSGHPAIGFRCAMPPPK